jgi:hypothetical protein
MLASLRTSRCRHNLNQIIIALQTYRTQYSQFPLYLTALYPKYLASKEGFICPMDRLDDRIGAQPEWMRAHDTGREDDLYRSFKTVDLDGPTGDAAQDEDSIPCSYLYALNAYREPEEELSWREHTLAEPSPEMPIVRCYHHLKAKKPPEFDELGSRLPQQYDDPAYEFPTFNILYNLTFKELPYRWREK